MSVLKDTSVSAQARRVRRPAPGKFIRRASSGSSSDRKCSLLFLSLSLSHTYFLLSSLPIQKLQHSVEYYRN